jgi:hypothetical protein
VTARRCNGGASATGEAGSMAASTSASIHTGGELAVEARDAWPRGAGVPMLLWGGGSCVCDAGAE